MKKKIKLENSNWNFSGNVPQNFDKHISKSIPLYEESHYIGLLISDFFIPENGLVCDIGCSTGTFLSSLADRHSKKKFKLNGYDEIPGMVKIAKKNCSKNSKINIIKEDVLKIKLKNLNYITSFFTIQFIHPSKRQKLFNNIYNGLEWGGGFLFFEKVRAPDARFQDMTNQIYTEIKINNGFSDSEIINKTRSLKGVMEPFSSNANIQLAKRAGFKDIMSVFKYVNFEGFLAIK
jgi:tRNA (cmo5U34)-methyltransferase